MSLNATMLLPKTLDSIELNWKARLYDPDASMDKAMRQTRWESLCQVASKLRDGLACVPLDHATNGLNNMVRLVQFSDGIRWVARIAMRRSAADLARLSSEIDTMRWIRRRSNLPVPEVFAYETNEHNAVGVPYVLMEFVPGNTAMDAAGGYETHHGIISDAHRPHFYRAVAKCHVEMTGLRLPKIGTIHLNPDGDVEVGPFPDIGGPFDTTTAFFEAWVDKARFPRRPDEILEIMRGGPADQVLSAINVFPLRFRDVAPQLVYKDRGPFPLCHSDFLHSNIIIDDSFAVLGIIDWEGACSLPLELVQFPRFLSCMPRLFDSPEEYDADGQPMDGDVRQRWRERREYVEMVKLFESPDDRTLSTCLEYESGQALSYVMEAYEGGKMGFYDKVMDGLEQGLSLKTAKEESRTS
ncbi:Aminoglycoside phosphotransferase [Niveomyces insectorum RCEF 264]|uniref:Aminoglycoside phosphotransferase n=1 Tax=Niveomyces insectorum RCEF 264 TaxID=1081102 RepID=A0A167WVQ8_9HYPO|nr:Aminoglycoside phosphotransferase [Niveomyces insectorum RCEF 264]